MAVAGLVVGIAVISGTGALLASCLRLSSIVAFVLAAYVAGFGVLVAIVLGLSPFGHVARVPIGVAEFASLLGSLVLWMVVGRPRPPRPGRRGFDLVRDPAVCLVAVGVGAGVVYSTVLSLLTPQNEGDALAYHLPRAMLWLQQGAVGYLPNAIDPRLNGNPPNAEIASLFTIAVSGRDTYVGLVQILALAVLAVGAFGVARRIGLDLAPAAFGALVLATLPVVALQASTALNDLVVASFLVVAAYFLIGARRELPLAAAAVALALGTKFTALLGLPALLVMAVTARDSRALRLGALAAGSIAGSYWIVVNLAETGHWDGGVGSLANQRPPRSPAAIFGNGVVFLLRMFDLSGSPGLDLLIYPIVSVVMIVAAVLLRGRRPAESTAVLRAALIVTAVPVLQGPLRDLVADTHRAVWNFLGAHNLAQADSSAPPIQRRSAATSSWYGPLGLMMVLGGIVLTIVAFRRRMLDRMALAVAAGPVIVLATMTVSLIYDPWRGRLIVFGMALSCATWGLALSVRPLAWAVACIGVTTLFLSLSNILGKPSGLNLLERADAYVPTQSVWGEPRWFTQGLLRGGRDDTGAMHFVQERVPNDATIAVAAHGNDFLSPYFGSGVDRTVLLVRPDGGIVPETASWLVLSPGARVRLCPHAWHGAIRTRDGWRVERRIGGSCSKAATHIVTTPSR